MRYHFGLPAAKSGIAEDVFQKGESTVRHA
jgi:hypothetical protein